MAVEASRLPCSARAPRSMQLASSDAGFRGLVSQSVRQAARQPGSQAGSQAASQPVSQSGSQPASQPVSQSVLGFRVLAVQGLMVFRFCCRLLGLSVQEWCCCCCRQAVGLFDPMQYAGRLLAAVASPQP